MYIGRLGNEKGKNQMYYLLFNKTDHLAARGMK